MYWYPRHFNIVLIRGVGNADKIFEMKTYNCKVVFSFVFISFKDCNPEQLTNIQKYQYEQMIELEELLDALMLDLEKQLYR